MTMTRPFIAATFAIALAVTASAGGRDVQAQQAPGAGQSGQPIMYGADDGEYTPDGIALRGRAEILQGDNRLRANAIQGAMSGGDITRIEATGEVYFVTPTQTIRGDRAVYTIADDTVVVTGDVILTQGQNVLTGGRLTYNVETGSARMEGAPTGRAGNRVQGVFYPEPRSN